jgi:predicted CXXCH cytochrome family protein
MKLMIMTGKKSKIFILLTVIFLYPAIIFSQEKGSSDACIECHSILEGRLKNPVDIYKSDIHFRKGYSCAVCHGGDSKEEDQEKSMSKSSGFIGVPRGLQATKICAKCHKDQAEVLSKSVHGQSSTGTGVIINSCVTCHGIHNITSVKSPNSMVNGANIVKTCSGCHSNASFMKKYNPGLKVDQLEKFKTSIHGKKIFSGDSKAANCASCHGNHDIKKVNDPNSKVYGSNIPSTCNNCHGNAEYMKEYKIPTDQFEKFRKSVHGIALLEKGDVNAPNCTKCHGDHGATPPEVESISKVCGTCHVLNSQMFQESPHKPAFDKDQIHECSACHNNHDISTPTDDMLGSGDKSVCIKCHKQGDKGFETAVRMKSMIDSLMKDVDLANYFISAAEQKGMDVSDAKFEANDIRKVLITSRTSTHYSDIDKYMATINEGFKITTKAKVDGEEAVREYHFRRLGLGISTIFITILCVALFLKLKKIERVQKIKS